ncbi:MAG: hypothetical protein EOP04_16785 [Proteobacteria bacterium]|nr:MAG: hypothetical protein EOP04_16785 [Pseudomonadota bacterium]
MDYTVGSPDFTKNDFSSNEAQVAYVYDPGVADSKPGVDRISTLFMDKGYFSATPQLYWNYQGYGEGHYGRPELSFIRDFMSPLGKQRFDGAGGMPSKPVETVKAYGASEYAASSLIVFQNGLITAGGVATSGQNDMYYKPFPSNLVPTAASVTNHGEFALITLWDTNTQKAKLAVIALGGSKPKDTFWNYEWQEVYPGFRNYSTWTFMKLLGYVDLPDMIAPTAVEAVGSEMIGAGLGANPGNKNAGEFPLTVQSNWNCFKANTECKYNTSGFALVSSRYEKKVTVVDLGPLFQKVKRSMFVDYNLFRQNVANVGMNDNQYPQTFGVDSSQMPKVVRTLTFDKQVTAISASLMRDNRGLVALEDGTVQVFNMDGLQTGGSGANISKTTEFKSGRNITRIAHMRHAYTCCGDGAEVRYQFILGSRGDNKAEWYDFKQGKIIRTLQDSRIVDLIGLEDNANHGTQSDVLTVLDYKGKSVRGYRYGPVIFHTNGGNRFEMGKGSDGKSDFEYSGEYKTPTGPFLININNVT